MYRAAQRRECLGLITAEDRQHSCPGPITTGARRGKVSTLRATWDRNMAPYWLLDRPYSLVSVKLVLLALQEP